MKVDPAGETYVELLPTIQGACRLLQRNHDLPRDADSTAELLSEASVHFMSAYTTHDESKGVFGKRVRTLVYYRLLETVRTNARRNALLCRTSIMMKAAPEQARSAFKVEDVAEALGEDAARLLELALQAPRINVSPKDIAVELRKFLRCEGWHEQRIKAAFAEVRNAL